MSSGRTDPALDRPDPSEKPDTVASGPGQADHSFTLQAIMNMQRDLGALGQKVDQLVTESHGLAGKVDTISHQVTFAKGAFWLLTAIVGVLAFLIVNKKQIFESGAVAPVAEQRTTTP